MHPITTLIILYLISRRLQENDDSGCERSDEDMETEISDLLQTAWDLLKSCVLWAFIVYSAGCLMLVVLEVLGRLFGL